MKKIPVAIRFDDPSETSNLEIERRVIASLERHGLTATFAVIPYQCDDKGELHALSTRRANHLLMAQRQGIVEIAQHGLCHKDLTGDTLAIPSEFLGFSEANQRSTIQQGLVHLQSIFGNSLDGFVPPFNTFDSNTVTALGDLKFKYVSGSLEVPASKGISILPGTCLFRSLFENIESARKKKKYDVAIIAVMHHSDFFESGGGTGWVSLRAFDQIIARLGAQADVAVYTVGELATLASTKLQTGLNNYRLSKKLHWRLRKRLPTGCLIMNPWWQAALYLALD
jgi:peptidoglycan/xylan/chitin deacetylase (PgdA/CDA1 family)